MKNSFKKIKTKKIFSKQQILKWDVNLELISGCTKVINV